ncbi:MAG: mannose-1-phosphate guanylyltransferase [Pirellulales bacterium]|jgi:mannose-1-phosphate guanylyltransferase|nr:mannose-1-phosphate guanylyltransferase [Pirellulales bacterium]
MIHAVIMAGGAGTRFWPESRADFPKQLITIAGNRSMIQATCDRLEGLVSFEQILIVTGERLVEKIAEQLPELSRTSIIGEPCRRDTAPCIGLAALLCSRTDPDATMVVMPADHVIKQTAAFGQAVAQAAALVDAMPGRIVTFGIRPTYPAETFGYIERDEPLEQSEQTDDLCAYRVKQFREKPKADVAQSYLDAGTFYWNSGIFVWKAATILEELAEREPEMLGHLRTITEHWESEDFEDVFRQEFSAIDGVSIDYAVMEHATDIVVLEAPFDWDDVGNWTALSRLRGEDEEGNTIDARHLGLNTTGSIVRGRGDHLLVTLGLSDCIVVHTPDATLVANRNDEESIRKLVQLIEEKGWTEHL